MDVVPTLLENIQAEYEQSIRKSAKLNKLRAKIENGTADYIDAGSYAEEVAAILSKVYEHNLTENALPNGKMYYNIASRVLEPTLKAAYEEVASVTMAIQNAMNEKAGISIKALKPDFNQDRVMGIIDKIANEDDDEEMVD